MKNNKNKYVRYLSINSKEGIEGNIGWFENVKIEFNPGLVAIIGNKGSGKSALADILSLAGASRCNEKDYSFLNTKKFKEIRTGKARDYEAELIWEDGKNSDKINLANSVNASSIERIKYVTQSYIETLCNEIEKKHFKMS